MLRRTMKAVHATFCEFGGRGVGQLRADSIGTGCRSDQRHGRAVSLVGILWPICEPAPGPDALFTVALQQLKFLVPRVRVREHVFNTR